jgi:hypothetical protein
MKKGGFIFLEIILGIFLIGLIASTFFPIIVSSFNNFNRIKEKSEMIYIAEMVAERLKSDEELFNEIIPQLESHDIVEIYDEMIDDNRYKCTLCKLESLDRIVDLSINVSTKEQEKNSNVYLKISIPKL